MSTVYGYCRISTPSQNIERQIRNILEAYPGAHIIKEVYTGTKLYGRRELDKLLHKVKPGDTLVFDEVSRMSRNVQEGFELYQDLYSKGIELVFLKEPHINTTTYKKAMAGTVPLTGTMADHILKGVNEYLLALAKEQITLAFGQAEKEVKTLQQRTKEGIETARLAGKQIGGKQGVKLTVKKAAPAKEIIRQYSNCFGGSLKDEPCRKLAGIARNTYYKYKRELAEELAGEQPQQ